MKKQFMVLVALVILAVVVHAQSNGSVTCTDTDGGNSGDEALLKRGDVKYGITTQTDVCLTSQEGVSTNSSKWLKEYFCSENPVQRQSKAYDCTREGFIGCENGACRATSSSGTNVTAKPKTPVNACGDKRVAKDKGEECDPPGDICFGKTSKQYGQCGADCKCKFAAAAEKPKAECGDEVKDEGEDCEKDAECPTNHLCSSCKCVKQLTPEEIEAMKTKPSPAVSAPGENTTPAPVDLTPKNFTESTSMKATSGVANFFKSIFSWIAA